MPPAHDHPPLLSQEGDAQSAWATKPDRLNDLILLIYQFFVLSVATPPALNIATLIELCAFFGINAGTVRTAMCRLKTQGFFSATKTAQGVSYMITPKAIMAREPYNKKVFVGEDVFLNWSGDWWLLTFSFEDTQGKKRHLLRRLLQHMDFAPLHRGVWLKPADPYLWLERELENLGLAEQVTIFTTKIAPLEKAQGLARRLWNLSGIFAEYETLQERLRAEVANYSDWDERTCFIQQMRLFMEFAAPLARNPLLPPQLLPAEQSLVAYRQLFNRLNERLMLKSRRFVNGLFSQTQGR